MKILAPFIFSLFISFSSPAQQTITMRGMWTKPEVEVIFGDYKFFFKIKDIDKAMSLLPQNEQVIFGKTSGLDTGRPYVVELLRSDMEYRSKLQQLMQRGVGAFLIMSGRAAIEKKNGKPLHTIQAIADPPGDVNGTSMISVDFYDPKHQNLIFSGWMDVSLYKKDIGFD